MTDMKKIESISDEIKNVIRYALTDGRNVCFQRRDIEEYGLEVLMQAVGVEMSTERMPVYQSGRLVGTLPSSFEPAATRSKSFLYDPRPGDFRRLDDRWEAHYSLGPGDFESIPDFAPKERDPE